MAAKRRLRLTDTAIARLRPEGREYTVWDTRTPGLGVRVRPTGGKGFIWELYRIVPTSVGTYAIPGGGVTASVEG